MRNTLIVFEVQLPFVGLAWPVSISVPTFNQRFVLMKVETITWCYSESRDI